MYENGKTAPRLELDLAHFSGLHSRNIAPALEEKSPSRSNPSLIRYVAACQVHPSGVLFVHASQSSPHKLLHHCSLHPNDLLEGGNFDDPFEASRRTSLSSDLSSLCSLESKQTVYRVSMSPQRQSPAYSTTLHHYRSPSDAQQSSSKIKQDGNTEETGDALDVISLALSQRLASSFTPGPLSTEHPASVQTGTAETLRVNSYGSNDSSGSVIRHSVNHSNMEPSESIISIRLPPSGETMRITSVSTMTAERMHYG